ncbi:MAG: FAD:protein FMN transferase [Clostridia bacterium]|nr:FAD:protein FMN transferase [Clostridia bacterium]
MKRIFSFLLAFITSISLASCGKTGREKFTDYSFDYFDTVTMIVGYEKSKDVFDENCKEIKKRLEEYHKLYNIYNTYEGVNNLCMLNKVSEGSHSELEVDDKIIDMLTYAKEMHTATNGNINVAMGSVLSIWHNYRESGIKDPLSAELPPIDILRSASDHTDIDDVIIDKENKTVLLSDPEMKLDVGAIAKGYAVEQVAQWMLSEGIEGYSLNVGGNIRIVGKKPDRTKWKVGIENPDTSDTENPYIQYLTIENVSVVTSGVYQRYYEVDGKKYHHIIDPETLMPGENFLSVTVVCQSSALGDALSTALFNMTYEEGVALLEDYTDAEALWVFPDGQIKRSLRFNKFCIE